MLEAAARSLRFTGEKLLTLDEKKRIVVPAKWRKLEKTYYLHAWPARITMTPPEILEVETARLVEKQGLSLEDQRIFEQMHFSSAREVTVDAQGRVVLPDDLCETAGLAAEVIMAGTGSRVEIWQPADWARFKQANIEAYNLQLKRGGG